MAKTEGKKIIATNKKAYHDYFVQEFSFLELKSNPYVPER